MSNVLKMLLKKLLDIPGVLLAMMILQLPNNRATAAQEQHINMKINQVLVMSLDTKDIFRHQRTCPSGSNS